MKAIILDTETTGLNDPEPVETAFQEVFFDSKFDLLAGECGWQRWKPSKPIELGALATHHILDEELENSTLSSEFELPEGVAYIIGHNVDYDWCAIGKPDVKRICTQAIARHLWPELDSHSQSALIYHLRRQEARSMLKHAHSALVDVQNCFVLLKEILVKSPAILDIESLYQYSESCRIPTHMPFGKYKGWPISNVPSDYVSWYLRQADTDPYLIEAFRR